MRRSFDNFAIVDSGLANNRNREAFLNIVGALTPEQANALVENTQIALQDPNYNPQITTVTMPTYNEGQQTSSGGFLSDFTAQELNQLGQTVGSITQAILQIRQQSQLAQTQEEQQALQAQALELERQRIEAMNKLADAQRSAGVPVTAGSQGLSTGAIVGIVAGGVLVIGLIMFLAFRQK